MRLYKAFQIAVQIVLFFTIAFSCRAQTQAMDMKTLIGKKAIVQRMPLYQPGTYQAIPQTYAGQTVTIIDVKPSAMYASLPKLTASQMATLPTLSRENIENVRGASTLVVQFSDGAKADTGAMPVLPSTLPNYLQVIVDPATPWQAVATSLDVSGMIPNEDSAAVSHKQECPVVVIKATSTDGGLSHALIDSLTKSEYERAVEKASNGGNDPHYLDVRMRNRSDKPIRAIEAFAAYANVMGDEGDKTRVLTQNSKPIMPGGEYKCYAVDTSIRSSNGAGDVKVYITRVRYEDNTFWQDNGSQSCSLTTRIK